MVTLLEGRPSLPMMSDIESGQYCWRTAGGVSGQANRTADCLGEQGGLATQPADTGKELNPVAPPASSDILARFGPSRIAESSMESWAAPYPDIWPGWELLSWM